MNVLRIGSRRANVDDVHSSRRGRNVERLEAELFDRLLSLLGGGRDPGRRIRDLVEGERSSDAVRFFVDSTSVAELETSQRMKSDGGEKRTMFS